MNIGTIAAVKGFNAQARRYEVIANNIANSSTPGFKREISTQNTHLEAVTIPDMSEGPVKHTGGSLDLAIRGEGFFEVQTEKGLRYTRQGRFGLNSEGELVTPTGDKVMSDRGDAILIEGDQIEIGPDGVIKVHGKEVETIGVVNFPNANMLTKEGATYYVPSRGAGEKEERPEGTSVAQGFLEQSNVMVPQEMIKMMDALRKFESFQKYMNTSSELDTKAINEVGMLR